MIPCEWMVVNPHIAPALAGVDMHMNERRSATSAKAGALWCGSFALLHCAPARMIRRVLGRAARYIACCWMSRCQCGCGLAWCAAAMLALTIVAAPAFAQREVPIRGDRLSGFVLPVEAQPGDIQITALRANAWSVDDTRRLLIEKDVRIIIAGQDFRADQAVVWINRVPSERGLINQIAVYFAQVTNPTREAGTGVAGRDLLVTGSTIGDVSLSVASLHDERPRRMEFLRRAEERLAMHLRTILADPPRLAQRPQVDRPPQPEPFMPRPGEPLDPERMELPDVIVLPEEEDATWLASPTGTVRYSAQEVNVEPGEDENVITLIGPLVVEYDAGEALEDWDRLSLTAERAVLFTDPAPLEEMVRGSFSAENMRGVYLEGNVIIRANDDEYVLRTPNAFYDFRTGQALMVDAVLRTYAREPGMLIYSRAKELRQIAEDQWEAQNVIVSTSEFATPHLSIGARRATITQRPARGDPGRTETHIDSRHLTMRAGDTPFFYWPRVAGTLREVPFRGASVGHRDTDGVQIETQWSLFGLLGVEPPEGVDAELKIDGYTKRGAGLGVELDYGVGASEGLLDLYGLYDTGEDKTTSGQRVDPDRDWRGVALWEHQTELDRHWTFQGQASWISDETFITTWRDDDFETRREYETSAYLKHQKDNAALTLLGKFELNDFISNDYLLASRGYQVDKLPEVAYRRYGDSLFWDSVTYSSETSYSHMRMRFNETTPRAIGILPGAYPIGLDDPIDEFLLDQGLRDGFVHRFDTRHEIAVPFQWNAFQVSPFIVGRFTMYDSAFEEFSSDTDKVRGHLSGGVRVSTQLHHVNNSVRSRLFDLNRIRHIIEPSATVWYGYTNVSGTDLPIYDQTIDPLGDGFAVRMGVRNTWQTQRGGPGRWRSEDVLMVDTNIVLNSNDADRRSPTPQFFDFRPEYSQFGDHVETSAVWQFSDSLSFVGRGIYDLDNNLLARGSIGGELRHTPMLYTYAEFRYIEISDSQLFDVGWIYQLTPKYRVQLSPQWDLTEDELRAIRLRVTRLFPDFEFIVSFYYDRIRDDTQLAASIGLVQF